MPDVEPQEVKPFAEMDDSGFLCGESQPPCLKPVAQGLFHLLGVLLGFTEHHTSICLSHHCPFADELSPLVVLNSQGLLHSVQRNGCQQGTDDTTLGRCSFRDMELPSLCINNGVNLDQK